MLERHLIKGDLIGHTGVVDQNIQCAELLLQNFKAMVYIRLLGDVRFDRHAFARRIGSHDLVADVLGVFQVQICHQNAGSALLGKFPAVRRTHSRTAAGDESNFPGYKLFHV